MILQNRFLFVEQRGSGARFGVKVIKAGIKASSQQHCEIIGKFQRERKILEFQIFSTKCIQNNRI